MNVSRMKVSDFVVKEYVLFFKQHNIKLSQEEIEMAMRQFNIDAVEQYVNRDIASSLTAERQRIRERYHQKNLRAITIAYAEKVLNRYRRNRIMTESVLNESRNLVKASAAGCDIYPC